MDAQKTVSKKKLFCAHFRTQSGFILHRMSDIDDDSLDIRVAAIGNRVSMGIHETVSNKERTWKVHTRPTLVLCRTV
jgi:hypothetical protein